MADERQAGWPPTIGLSVEDAAQALRVSDDAIRAAIKDGGLPARLVGKGWRIEESALRAWLASGTGEGRSRNASMRGSSTAMAEADLVVDENGRVIKDKSYRHS